MMFANEHRAEIKAKFPGLKVTEQSVKLGDMWKALDPEKKKVRLNLIHSLSSTLAWQCVDKEAPKFLRFLYQKVNWVFFSGHYQEYESRAAAAMIEYKKEAAKYREEHGDSDSEGTWIIADDSPLLTCFFE